MKRSLPFLLLSLALLSGMSAGEARPARRSAQPPGEWRVYSADHASSRYSPLTQIHRGNFKDLRVAWRWDSVDNAVLKLQPNRGVGPNQATPLMVNGILYTSTSLNQVAAIDAATGKTLWAFNPESYGGVHRGVAYWEGPRKGGGKDRRLLIGINTSYLLALDADTGKLIPSFGENGRIDLAQGLRRPVDRTQVNVTSPPIICRDVVVIGGAVNDFG
ncbi:MAG TPA: pyrroloquinoline quinone-dependent dehydrogenase, partial [Armatimonadota bacterium]|nr:pyrroloquinoline quinone-dependent dehydrogenase [Armatimonadota bacterium]